MDRFKLVRERRRVIPRPLALLCFIATTLFAANYANAAQLRINPADGPGNSIILNGDFTFSVYQSNGNIDIAVSGVKLVFDCDTATDIQTCVVAVDDSVASSQGASVTSGNTQGTTTTGTGSNTGTQDCVGFGSNQQCTGGDDSTTTNSTTSGDQPADEDPPQEDECTSIACLLQSDTSTSTDATEGTDFAVSDRVLTFNEDFGSAGSASTGNVFRVELSESTVRVGTLTMKDGNHKGAISFVPTSKEPLNASLRLWISTSPDGAPVSDACTHAGSFDSAVDISVGSAAAGSCELKPSSTYYLNAAACATSEDDYNCTKGAKNATRIGAIYLSARYY